MCKYALDNFEDVRINRCKSKDSTEKPRKDENDSKGPKEKYKAQLLLQASKNYIVDMEHKLHNQIHGDYEIKFFN